jgi:hypothetical protein
MDRTKNPCTFGAEISQNLRTSECSKKKSPERDELAKAVKVEDLPIKIKLYPSVERCTFG